MKNVEQVSQVKSKPNFPIDIENLDEIALQKVNPRIVEAIQAIQAERLGKEPISWSDFSSHSQK